MAKSLSDPTVPGPPVSHAPLAGLLNAEPSRPYVIAQLGQSLDGRIATATGDSQFINRDAALDHLHRLRAHVDAVVVGVQTVVADDPQLTVRRVPGRSPARVVIDPRNRSPRGARIFKDDGIRRVIVGETPPDRLQGIEFVSVGARGAVFAPADIIAALNALGLRKLLIEGGAATISAFIDADALDRLHVLIAPVIIGSGIQALSLQPVQKIFEARRPVTTVHVLDDGDVLFDCDMRNIGRGKK